MNRMDEATTRELEDRIRTRGWGWRRAFEAWFVVHGAVPDLEVRDDGERVVLRDATQFITTNPDYLRSHGQVGYAGILQHDGTLQLDSAGEYRYEPIGDLDHGFTAYERVPT